MFEIVNTSVFTSIHNIEQFSESLNFVDKNYS